MAKKIALVTSGFGGIGTAVCHALADQGCHEYANYYLLRHGDELRQWQVSNAAGITRDLTFKKMKPEDWSSVIQINPIGTINMTNAAVKVMLEQGSGFFV